jgi:hypothetical protein
MRHLWPLTALVAAASLWVAAAQPWAADPSQATITIAASAATQAQLECPG